MKLSVTGHQMTITPAIAAHIEQRMQHQHWDRPLEAHFVLTHELNKSKDARNKVEVNVHVAGKVLHAGAVSADMYDAIDNAASKIMRQLERYKTQRKFSHQVPQLTPLAA